MIVLFHLPVLPDIMGINIQRFCFLKAVISDTKKPLYLRNSAQTTKKSHCFGLWYFFHKSIHHVPIWGALQARKDKLLCLIVADRIQPYPVWKETCILCMFFVLIFCQYKFSFDLKTLKLLLIISTVTSPFYRLIYLSLLITTFQCQLHKI